MKIFLVRHGESTGDIEDRYGGSYDDHLTANGREQVAGAANKLIGKGIEVIFSSPLVRARESAEIIGKAIGAPVTLIDGLQERHYGVLTGLNKKEAAIRYPEVVKFHQTPTYTEPDGESIDDFWQRVIGAFYAITAMDRKVVAVVSHGGSIRCIYDKFGSGELPEKLKDGHIIDLAI